MSRDENYRVIENYWVAMNTNDWRAAAEFFSDDFVLEWPQSGERIRGRDNFVAVNTNYPANGRWGFAVNQIVAGETDVVSDVNVTDGVIQGRVLTFSQMRDGKIVSQKEFWPEPFAAPEWRAQWVEKTGA